MQHAAYNLQHVPIAGSSSPRRVPIRLHSIDQVCRLSLVIENEVRPLISGEILHSAVFKDHCRIVGLLCLVEVPGDAVFAVAMPGDQDGFALVGVHWPSVAVVVAVRKEVEIVILVHPHVGLVEESHEREEGIHATQEQQW